jgi:hypothetical protein
MNKGGTMKVYGLVLILILSVFSTVLVPSMFNDGSKPPMASGSKGWTMIGASRKPFLKMP